MSLPELPMHGILLQVQVANTLNIPLIVTEHYSKGEHVLSDRFLIVSHFITYCRTMITSVFLRIMA